MVNDGDIMANGVAFATGVNASANGRYSPILVLNNGDISANSTAGSARGISAYTYREYSPIYIGNSGTVTAKGATASYGVYAHTEHRYSGITIINDGGTITANGAGSYAVQALTHAEYSDIVLENRGVIQAHDGGTAVRLEADSADALVVNYGTIAGGSLGILVSGDSVTGVINYGSITADSLYAIKVVSGSGYSQSSIVNFGYVKGFVQVFGLGIYNQFAFINEPGGVFEARGTSFMGGGDFFNQQGATVHTAENPNVSETTSFTELTSFQNQGLISLQDGGAGDIFTITAGPYGYSTISFTGSGDLRLAVDTFLGGPNSVSDVFIVDGDVSGRTKVTVNKPTPALASSIRPEFRSSS